MFISPFHNDDIVAFVFDHIIYTVSMASSMFDQNLLTRDLWTQNSNKEEVVACLAGIHIKCVAPAERNSSGFVLKFMDWVWNPALYLLMLACSRPDPWHETLEASEFNVVIGLVEDLETDIDEARCSEYW